MRLMLGLAVILGVFVAAMLYGSYRWNAGTKELRSQLEAARRPVQPTVVDFAELEGLPPPVQRYFRAVLKNGQPMLAGVRAHHTGTFNMDETADQWKPFTSDQKVVTQRPGFDWDARIAIMPGLLVRVHDAYVAGEGFLHASLFGLYPLVKQRGTDDLAEGELMRFLAEAVWYPTALLPSQGVRWSAVDDRSAFATLTEGTIGPTLLITFNDQGLVDAVRAEGRGRIVGGQSVSTPWLGRFWAYTERQGMRIPLEGEVAWALPEGIRPYWRGHLTEIVYEFAQ